MLLIVCTDMPILAKYLCPSGTGTSKTLLKILLRAVAMLNHDDIIINLIII